MKCMRQIIAMISLHNFSPWNRYVSLSLKQFTRKETQISLLKEIVIVYWEFVSRKSKNENNSLFLAAWQPSSVSEKLILAQY